MTVTTLFPTDIRLFATVGLGVNDLVYRIIALFVSMVSGIDSVHRFGA